MTIHPQNPFQSPITFSGISVQSLVDEATGWVQVAQASACVGFSFRSCGSMQRMNPDHHSRNKPTPSDPRKPRRLGHPEVQRLAHSPFVNSIISLADRRIMAAWHGRECGSPFATRTGIDGYPKLGTRGIAPRRNSDLCCGTREALTAERGRRGSRRDALFARGAPNIDKPRAL